MGLRVLVAFCDILQHTSKISPRIPKWRAVAGWGILQAQVLAWAESWRDGMRWGEGRA